MEHGVIDRLIILLVILVLMGVPTLSASSSEALDMAESLNIQLDATDDPKAKAKLYCYRARNYTKSGEHEKAKDDYLRALNASYEGWILKELGHFMYKRGEYEKAYNVSVKLLNDFPYLEKEANHLKTQSKKKWEEEYLRNNPPTITIDTAPNANRVSRHDLIQQTESHQKTQYGGGKQTNKSNNSGYKYWSGHPKTKNIPVPKQRNMDF
jgi:tetratricopeptide (TPR) repeat protein